MNDGQETGGVNVSQGASRLNDVHEGRVKEVAAGLTLEVDLDGCGFVYN